MPTRATQHLHHLKQISMRRAHIGDHTWTHWEDEKISWDDVLRCAKALKLADGTAAVRSMQYGTRLEAGCFGVYTGYTRHIDIAASLLTERALATCFHEFTHALLHWDCNLRTMQDNLAWLECEADATADLVRMMMGYAPRRYTQNTFANLGNHGDICAFFHFSGDLCAETAQTIYDTWQRANSSYVAVKRTA